MNFSQETLDYNAKIAHSILGNTIFILCLLLIGIVGNVVVLAVYLSKLGHSSNRYFIPILAAVDFISCLSGSVFTVLSDTMNIIFPYVALCKILYFLVWFFTMYSACLMLPIGVTRYLKVCRPLKTQMNLKKNRIAVGTLGIFSFVITLPLFFVTTSEKTTIKNNGTMVEGMECKFDSELGDGLKGFLYFRLAIYIAILGATICMYIPIGRQIYRRFGTRRLENRQKENHRQTTELRISTVLSNGKLTQPSNITPGGKDVSDIRSVSTSLDSISVMDTRRDCSNSQPSSLSRIGSSLKRRVKTNFTTMFFIIVIVFIIAYIPSCAVAIYDLNITAEDAYSHSDLLRNWLIFLSRVFFVNHVINPFVYGYFDMAFRQELVLIFQRVCGKCS